MCKAFIIHRRQCAGVLSISFVYHPSKIFVGTRFGTVDCSVHGDMVNPLTRYEIQPISRFSMNRMKILHSHV